LRKIILTELKHDRRLLGTLARFVDSQTGISSLLKRNIREILHMMPLPTRGEVAGYERRLQRLEKQINTLSRKIVPKSGKGA